ncbi:hypothetical protein [Paenibacillus aceris]|uniref:DUF2157 domain-containing protein n=1 Tax=Paenibacillus aceris TaxID=869555 RepID=A0ABS4HSF3_9BACL|nr:hypothetical protein [Paenibacillus aceris]MBP1961445.1 hypothetical protein [Paenibacillus aceris]NHW37776.1 hypothetical protein [Paenibacillus aceris]
MDTEKRKVIVREIEHWRRSKLLPEHYCDFLMNLYLDESTPKPASIMGVSVSSIANSSWKIWLVILAAIAALALSALNFNSFGMPMQIGISTLFVIICYSFAYRQFSKSPVISYLLCGAASISLLLLGLYLMDMYDVSSSYTYIGYLAFCSVVWMINGVVGRMGIFQFCGWLGLVGTYGWLLLHKLNAPGWFSLEISWIPVSIVLIWIAWLAHHTNKQVAGILLLVGGLVWFAPEAMTFLTDVNMSSRVIQLSFTGKLVSAGAAFFVLRKKWVEWVV